MARITQTLAMGVGAAGAMTDVTSYVTLVDGVSRSWGRHSEFDDTVPGEFSFVLENADGRFTPGHPSSALATTLTEGMQVCWGLGSRLVAGTVGGIEPSFPGGESGWAQVRVTCYDMLGVAARRTLSYPPHDLFTGSTGLFQWRLDEPAGYGEGAELNGAPSIRASSGVFGVTDSHIPAESVLSIPVVSGATNGALTPAGAEALPTQAYGAETLTAAQTAETMGAWGFWVERTNEDVRPEFFVSRKNTNPWFKLTLEVPTGRFHFYTDFGVEEVFGPYCAPGQAYYVHVASNVTYTPGAPGEYTVVFTFFVDGVEYGSATYVHSTITLLTDYYRTPRQVFLYAWSTGSGADGSVYYSRISHTLNAMDESALFNSTSTIRFPALVKTSSGVTLDTLPTLSDAIIGETTSDQSTLDAFNELIRAEQGSIYTATTGTLTNPTQKVKVRARDRSETVSYSFNAETEASNTTDFIRDLTNMVSEVTVDGPTQSVTYIDSTLSDRAGSKNVTENVPLRDYTDLYSWASDRVWRGSNVNLRAASITIDAFTTPTDRSADLLALVPGDRIQITGLPSTQLGFSTWDGWLLGVEESHTLTEHTFTLYLQPVLPRPIILDTDVVTAGGVLTLTSDITSGATAVSVTSSGDLFTTTGGDFPQTIRIDSEVLTVTAVSGASSPQTFTVTRAATDPVTGLATTAAAHLAGADVELASYGVLAF